MCYHPLDCRCIVSHAYLFPPSVAATEWLLNTARLNITRYSTVLSSRRALLNTIVAMNPESTDPTDRTSFREEALRALDPILATGQARSDWEAATLETSHNVSKQDFTYEELSSKRGESNFLGKNWTSRHGSAFWSKFIPEGTYVASKMRRAIEKKKRPTSG